MVSQAAVVVFLASATVWAGGGPQNTLVVVNDNSLESLELGQYYQGKRDIPEGNICHIRVATNYSVDTATFSNDIRGPVLNFVTNSVLSNQIDYIVFSKDIPYRIYKDAYGDYRHSSLSASMFYGFKWSGDAHVQGCSNASGSRSDYYVAERWFSHSGDPSSNRYYLSSVLAATNLVVAKTLIDRATAADASSPTGTVYYYRTLDARNIQKGEFENSLFMIRLLNGSLRGSQQDGYTYENPPHADVMGLMVGQCCSLGPGANTYRPGAFAEHLTSYGGVLYNESEFQQPNREQDRALSWIEAGCAGSYGTIVEPCAYTNKFPRAQLHYWYGRGFSLGESLYMSVQNPYQGVAAGDLLCSPYAVPCTVTVGGLSSGQVVSGTVSLSVTGAASSAARPLDQVDLFVDGVFVSTLTNVYPTMSNVVSVAINGTGCTYRVPLNAPLFNVATGLAASINASNLGVTAGAYSDRVEIKQNALGQPAASWTCVAGSSTGSAGVLTTFAATPSTNFIESPNFAHKILTLSGNPVSGDVVRLVVTNLDGAAFTNRVTAMSTNDTPYSLLTNLAATVNADPGLTNSRGCLIKWVMSGEGYLVARTNGWEGCNLYASYAVVTQLGSSLVGPDSAGNFTNNSHVMSARATVFLSEGRTNLVGAYSLNTATLADGPHELMAVAYEGTAVRTQGRTEMPFVVNNHTASCTITSPADRASFLLGTSVTVYVEAAAAGGGSVSTVQCYVEGKLLASTGTAPYVFTFSTTNYGVGLVGIQAKSVSSNGDAVLSAKVDVLVLPDYDFDSMDDNWETSSFGSITNWGAWDDPDTDGVYNVNEYVADTQPTNSASKFTAVIYWRTNSPGYSEIDFGSSTARQYWVHYRENPLDSNFAWLMGSNALTGNGGTSVWYDNGTDLPAPTNTYRYYRVRVRRP